MTALEIDVAHGGWHRAPLAALDFETTGVDPHRDRVLSYALLDGPGVVITGLVDPGIPIPPASAEVHGITAAMLRGAPTAAAGLAGVVDWVRSLIERRVPLVVFNAAYDLTMLRAEAARLGLEQPDWSRLLVIDPHVLDWGAERGALGPRRLVDVALHYGIDVENAHDAVCDARAARDVAVALGARHRQIGTASLGELMAVQRRWYAERVQEWNCVARERGRPLDDPAGWPLTDEPRLAQAAGPVRRVKKQYSAPSRWGSIRSRWKLRANSRRDLPT